MKILKFDHDKTVYREGEEGRSMYLIRSGSVAILSGYGKAGEKKLAELGSGDVFGAMSILESMPRVVAAVALEDGTELEEIGAEQFDDYLSAHPETARRLLTEMSRQIRELVAGHVDVYRTVADYGAKDGNSQRESDDRIARIVSIYQNRYPALFNIPMKEAKDDVRFVFDASKE